MGYKIFTLVTATQAIAFFSLFLSVWAVFRCYRNNKEIDRYIQFYTDKISEPKSRDGSPGGENHNG